MPVGSRSTRRCPISRRRWCHRLREVELAADDDGANDGAEEDAHADHDAVGIQESYDLVVEAGAVGRDLEGYLASALGRAALAVFDGVLDLRELKQRLTAE